MINRETLTVDGSDMLTLSALPEGAGPHPVYIECCHAPGQDGFTENVLERWAEVGYAAYSHILFHRQGPDAKGREALGILTDEELVRDCEALVAHARTGMGEDAKLTIGGHCMGGRVALLAGASIDGFYAVADFWGGNVMTAKGRDAPTVIDMVGNITCPVIGFFGNDDGNPAPEDVDRLDAELSRHGVTHTFHRYDGAGHAFQNFLNEANYRESQSEDAWGKVITFFGDALA